MTVINHPGREGARSNSLFNDNKLKLGLFGINCDRGCAMSTAPDGYELSWSATKQVAQTADRAGFEILVPVARWMGLGGDPGYNFNDRSFETYSWAAGLAEATEQITLVTTSHVQTIHPIMAAKQAATIDHISGGRYCLNIVCGWFQPEFEMFGSPFLDHDARYDYAAEWWQIVQQIWQSEEPFDFEGDYFKVHGAVGLPNPLQSPRPPAINAGGSEKGRNFISEHCDIGYVVLTDHDDLEVTRRIVDSIKTKANDFGRNVQVWTHAYVVQRDTSDEAERFLNHFAVDHRNETAVDNAAHFLGVSSQIMPEEAWNEFKLHLAAGYGGYGIVGDADQVAQKLSDLSDIGIDGVCIHSFDYLDMLERFNRDVLPQLESAGLRSPHSPGS